MKAVFTTMAAVAVIGISCGPAMASDPVSKQLTIQGTVDTIATFPDTPAVDGTAENAALSGSDISITHLAGSNLLPAATGINIKYAGVHANYSAKVGLYSMNQGLSKNLDTASPPTGYTNKVNYTVAAIRVVENQESELAVLDTSTASSVVSAPQEAYTGDIKLNIAISAPTSSVGQPKLMEGTYSDTLTLKIGTSL